MLRTINRNAIGVSKFKTFTERTIKPSNLIHKNIRNENIQVSNFVKNVSNGNVETESESNAMLSQLGVTSTNPEFGIGSRFKDE